MHSVDPGNIAWKKSSYSAADGDCVQVGRLADGHIAVRDSKNIAMPALSFTSTEWRAFIGDVKCLRQDRA
jgi:hypothetical protein